MKSVSTRSTSTRTALIVAQLRDSIEHGRLVPGQRLIEADLTQEYGVSRGPLREAFARLSAEGLVEVVPNRGAVVRRLGRRELADTMAIREALEGLAASLAARNIAVGDNKNRLAHFMRESCLGKQKPTEDFLRENEVLHGMLVEFADNLQLSDLIERLRLQAFPRRASVGLEDAQYRLSSSVEHLRVADAVLRGDEAAAYQAMRMHLENAKGRLLQAMPQETEKPERRDK